MSDLPFEAGYAKSGRSSCKHCCRKIDKGVLRIAMIRQSPFHDGKLQSWFHEECFFMSQRVNCISEIGKFNTLRQDDKERIKNTIGTIAAPASGKRKQSANFCNSTVGDFAIEYSPGSATCKHCDIEIFKGHVRISKIMNSESWMPRDWQSDWYHLHCFAEERDTLGYIAGGDALPGYKSLNEDDQILVKDTIPAKLTDDEVLTKKMKTKPKDEEEIMKKEYLENKIEKQNLEYHKYRDALKELQKSCLHQLLLNNSQKKPAGVDECLDRLADCMVFGLLEPCPQCGGQMVLDTFNYKCTGHTTWAKCSYSSVEPHRKPMMIPEELKSVSPFKEYKPKTDVRLFEKITKDIRTLPLKHLQFFLHGDLPLKADIEKRILKLGGVVVSKLTETTAAIISSKHDVVNIPSEAQDNDTEVVEESFLDLIDPVKGTVANTLELIKLKNIAPWSSDVRLDPTKCMLQDGELSPNEILYNDDTTSTMTLTIKGGTAVDPKSGLEDVAHVYTDRDGDKYTVVLCKTDVEDQKNSYYKLQVLKADKSKEYWLFRSWGRIGTTIGGTKLDKYKTSDEAVNQFSILYTEKTKGNTWDCRDVFEKVPEGYYPIEVDYGDDEGSVMQVDVNCKLPLPVQHLVQKILDIDLMNTTMLAYELDVEKMPLGKLSKKQIKSGYPLLKELVDYVRRGANQTNILDATNRFYTMIPHDFGEDKPPLLDNVEAIKKKILMLDDLLEIEIAYRFLNRECDISPSLIGAHYLKLKTAISPVDCTSPEFQLIQEYVTNTHAEKHSNYTLEIQQVFRVVREGEDERYKPFRKLHNRRLLWHGSRVTNFAGILSQGLRTAPPEAPVTGYMFGKGIYFADMVSKSANYCCTSRANPVGIMLLSEVALGNMKECFRAESIKKLPADKHSAWGVGRTQPDPALHRVLDDGTIVPLGKPVPNPSGIQLNYNEFIVYDVAQVNLKYLLEMKFNYK